MASFNNEWLDEPEEPGKALPFPNERCPKCEGLGWGFKRWEDATYTSTQYEFYCPECGYNIVGELGEPLWEGHLKSPTVLNSITEGATLAQEPVLPYLSRPRIPIISSITETDGQGESILTYRDDSEEPIGYLSYHLDRINKTVGVNSVWAHPDKRREGIASALLKELRQKYQDWKIDVSWTTDDGTAWAQANDELIDLGDYKTSNAWDDTDDTDQIPLPVSTCSECLGPADLFDDYSDFWNEGFAVTKCLNGHTLLYDITGVMLDEKENKTGIEAHPLSVTPSYSTKIDSIIAKGETTNLKITEAIDRFIAFNKLGNSWEDTRNTDQLKLNICPECSNTEELVHVPAQNIDGTNWYEQLMCPKCNTAVIYNPLITEPLVNRGFIEAVTKAHSKELISNDEFVSAQNNWLKYRDTWLDEHLSKTANAWDTHPDFNQKRLYRDCLVEGCTDPAPDYGPALCESCLAHRNSYERGGGRGNRANNKKQVDDWLTKQANAWDDVDDSVNTQQVINLCPRCGSRCAIDRGYSCNKCSDEKYFACFNCLKEFTCPYTDHEWERNIVPVDYLGWAKLFNLQQIPLPESLANSGDPRLESIWRSYERQRQASASWDDAENPNQLPFTNSICPSCENAAYEYKESSGQKIFHCPSCLLSNWVWKSDNGEWGDPESDEITMSDIRFGLENWPLKSSSWDSAWDEKVQEGQTFMPVDQNWMDRNIPLWAYYCPKCYSENVRMGPASSNGYQIPNWEDIDLVDEIESLHSENPEKDIDYCPDCNNVWIRPELDYVVHRQRKSAADPEWWSEFVADTPYMLHFFKDDPNFDVSYSITNDGLIPYMAPLHDAPSSNWEGPDLEILEPRPGHVYLMHPAFYNRVNDWDPKYNTAAIVDIRSLDPSRVNPDEDWFQSRGREWISEHGSSGAWAEAIDLRDPDQVRTSMEQGSIAYKGGIPREAIVDIVDKEDLGVLLRSIQNPSPREYPSDLAHYAPFFEQSLKQAGAYEDARELLSGGGGWQGMPEPDKDAMAKYWRGKNNSWTKGEWGKGVVYDNDEVATWNVSKDGYPHHSHAGDYKFSVWISPDGYFTSAGWINTNGSFGVEEFFDESDLEPLAELGLKYMDPWDWVMEYWGDQGSGYGHAQNVLDILNRQANYEIQF